VLRAMKTAGGVGGGGALVLRVPSTRISYHLNAVVFNVYCLCYFAIAMRLPLPLAISALWVAIMCTCTACYVPVPRCV
jgi:hypothetical protein